MVEAKGKKPNTKRNAKNTIIKAKSLEVEPITSFNQREKLRNQGNTLREKRMKQGHLDKQAFNKDQKHADILETKKGVQQSNLATQVAEGKHQEKNLKMQIDDFLKLSETLEKKFVEFSEKAMESLDKTEHNYYSELAKECEQIAQQLQEQAGGLFKQLMGIIEKLQKSNVQNEVDNAKNDLNLVKYRTNQENDLLNAQFNESSIQMLQKLVKDTLNLEENWKKEGLGNLKFKKEANQINGQVKKDVHQYNKQVKERKKINRKVKKVIKQVKKELDKTNSQVKKESDKANSQVKKGVNKQVKKGVNKQVKKSVHKLNKNVKKGKKEVKKTAKALKI